MLAGVVDSRRSLLSYDGLDASRALAFFNDEAVEQDEESLFLWMRAHPYDDLVVLDVTASQQLADQYLDFSRFQLLKPVPSLLIRAAPFLYTPSA